MTKRQMEILLLINQGLSNNEIAQKLGIHVQTVKMHITAMFKKLGVKNRLQLLLYAQKEGIINYEELSWDELKSIACARKNEFGGLDIDDDVIGGYFQNCYVELWKDGDITIYSEVLAENRSPSQMLKFLEVINNGSEH